MPFGVLVDTIIREDSYELPVHIIAHFRSFPENQLIKFKGRDSIKFCYMNCLKESNTIKYGSSKEVLNLSTSETMKLIEIVFTDGKKMFKEFCDINKKICELDFENLK